MNDERRKHARIQKTEQVFYSRPFSTYDPLRDVTSFVGQTLDISGGGACIMTNHRFTQGDCVKVSFNGIGNATAIATVRWCDQVAADSYRVGLQIPCPEIS